MHEPKPALPAMQLGLLGGSFNPVHFGHLRMAIEVREALGLDRVDLVPTAMPPHKPNACMLPYDMRVAMVAAAIRNIPGLAVSEVEAVLPSPSYTFRTLATYKNMLPDVRLHFIMGAGDLLDLPKWHRGRELPDLATLVVAPRRALGLTEVQTFVPRFWPGAVIQDSDQGDATMWQLPLGGRVQYVSTTRLDISATEIRRRWLASRCLAGLTAHEVDDLLAGQWETVRALWGGEAGSVTV